jgi:hypothetical protein
MTLIDLTCDEFGEARTKGFALAAPTVGHACQVVSVVAVPKNIAVVVAESDTAVQSETVLAIPAKLD